MKHRNLRRAVDKRHLASEKLIKSWEPILRERKLREAILCSKEHIITVERQIIITMNDYPVDSLKATNPCNKICVWSWN